MQVVCLIVLTDKAGHEPYVLVVNQQIGSCFSQCMLHSIVPQPNLHHMHASTDWRMLHPGQARAILSPPQSEGFGNNAANSAARTPRAQDGAQAGRAGKA
jgi:hypothetical protein